MVILGNRFYGSSWEFWLLGSSGYFLIWTPGRSGHTVQFLFTVNGKSVCHVRSCSLLDHAPPTHKEPKKLKRDTWLKWLNKGLIMSVTAPPPPPSPLLFWKSPLTHSSRGGGRLQKHLIHIFISFVKPEQHEHLTKSQTGSFQEV